MPAEPPHHEDEAAWEAAIQDRYIRAALTSAAMEQVIFWLQERRRRRSPTRRAEALATALAWSRIAARFA